MDWVQDSGLITVNGQIEEVVSLPDQIRNGTTLKREDVSTLKKSLAGEPSDHIVATEAIRAIAQTSPATLEDDYPELVELIFKSRKSRAVGVEFLHNLVSFRRQEISIPVINSGVTIASKELMNQLSEFGSATGGPEDRVLSGGAAEAEFAMSLRDFADGVEGRKQLVVEAAADAVEAVVEQRASETGCDPIDALVDLRVAHDTGNIEKGISERGIVTSMDAATSVDARQLFKSLFGGLAGSDLILSFERDPVQLLRSEAVVAERL